MYYCIQEKRLKMKYTKEERLEIGRRIYQKTFQ